MTRMLARMRMRAMPAVLHSAAPARLLMAISSRRLAGHDGRAPRALAAALRSMALGRVPADEREWAGRIEERREELHSRPTVVRPFEARLPETVADASRFVSIPPVWTRFLTRLVRELSPEVCVELGTGLGISTAYQAAALELNGRGRLLTLDGSSEWMAVAEEGLAKLRLDCVETRVGPIGETLPGALGDAGPVEYALIDAEHTEEATVGYFERIAPHLSAESIVVLDDIPWSPELRRAWKRIAASERVSVALPLGRLGLVVVSENGRRSAA